MNESNECTTGSLQREQSVCGLSAFNHYLHPGNRLKCDLCVVLALRGEKTRRRSRLERTFAPAWKAGQFNG